MRRELWLGLVVAGVLMYFSLGWLSLFLLLVVPGLALLLLLKERVSLAEIVGVSGSLSVLFLPVAVLALSPLSVRYAGMALGLLVVIIGFYCFLTRRQIAIETRDWQVTVLAALIFLLVLTVTMKTFFVNDNGLVCATTHAADLNFHLSIAQRFAASPSVPPQDPYLPGYAIVYNWFAQVVMGELSILSGVGVLDVLKAIVPFVSALILVDAFLLARTIFSDDLKASLVGAVVYVASSGLSWLYIVYLNLTGKPIDLFRILVYEWAGVMSLKYDTPSLYMFLPQTQTFGLMCLIFCMYLYLVTVSKKSWAFAVVTGLALASLIMYHMVTAFPVLVALGIFFMCLAGRELYLVYRSRQPLLAEKNLRFIGLAALPLAISAVAGIYQVLLLSASAGSQITVGHDKGVYVTLLFTISPLLPFALWGMYLAVRGGLSHPLAPADNVPVSPAQDDLAIKPPETPSPPESEPLRPLNGAWLLIIYAALNFLFLNVFEMNMTHNTYRFIVYLAVPVSLFAGLALARWLFSRSWPKTTVAALVILLLVPSTVAIVLFYNDSGYVHAPTADVNALAWIKENTPVDAIFYEEPSHFVRLPVLTGRQDVYAGEIYTWQYHNVDRQREMEAILRISDGESLYNVLAENKVDYVFVGSKEAGYPLAVTIRGVPRAMLVYDEDGVKIYMINRA